MSVSGGLVPYSICETKKVSGVQFQLLSPETIKNLAVCEVNSVQTVDPDGRPLDGGINDLRMGTVDKSLDCKTCGCNFEHCPGHFGYIELAEPVYHVGYIDEIIKVLRCICFNCGRILRPSEGADKKFDEIRQIKNPERRFHALYNICKGVRVCSPKEEENENMEEKDVTDDTKDNKNTCGWEQPIYRKGTSNCLQIDIEYKDEGKTMGQTKRQLTPLECLRVFQKIKSEDLYLMGFDAEKSRPEWMIIQNLAVCPPQVRPSVSVDATLRCEDDLTYQYTHILKVNQDIKRERLSGAQQVQISDNYNLLQFYVATLMNNEIPSFKVQQRSGRPIKAFSTRLKGKEGRLRGNLMGKRVDFSARSVISPDPNLLLDELGVPKSIAMNLTFPERVTELNIDYLKKLVENGPTKWPGAKTIIRENGVKIDLRYVKSRTDIHLAVGYIVERHCQNGDFVIFNRQPSLHKMSMMGHRVHVLPYSTFRLNLSVTTPYNADFDGDEMNMHVPQSYETKAEIMNIMHVPKQIVSPQSNKPVMGIVQDTLIGVKLFTHRDNFITYEEVMNLVMWINDFNGNLPVPAILKPVPLWTGKQIFSLILPKINLEGYTANHDKDLAAKMNLIDSFVQISNGELIQGILSKKTVGNTSGGLVHCIWNECGPDETLWFLSNCQKLVNNWLLISGFTVGVSDIIADEETNKNVQNTLKKVKEEVKKILREAKTGVLKCQPGKGMIGSFEANANGALNSARENAGKTVKAALKLKNHLRNMVIAGSKGNDTNISQIIGCVGQQNVEGQRIPFNFNKRTLPHFVKDDYGAESRGFVENSYLRGLNPQEFYFHAMGGREGIIDTAVKTSETGYIQRRLIKGLEDVMVQYDGTVRNGRKQIVQFLYGEDGMAGEYIEQQNFDIIDMKDEDLIKNYSFFEENIGMNPDKQREQLTKYLDPKIADNIIYDNFLTIQDEMRKEFLQIKEDRSELRDIFKNIDKQYLPVNVKRIIINAKMKFGINQNSISNLNPLEIREKISQLKKSLILVKGEDPISVESQEYATKLFFILLNCNLACKKLIKDHRLNTKAFEWIIGEITSKFYQAIARPGEMVGNIAAQSIGEPATQMTLNTFHFAGVSSLNVTLGVPRLKEVINVAKKLKTPSMKIHLKPEYNNEETVKKLTGYIEITTMENITSCSEIYYDPDLFNTLVTEDQDIINFHMSFYEDNYRGKEQDYSPWVLRLELDNKIIYEKNLNMNYIESIIKKNFDNLDIIHSEDNREKKIFRIRIKYVKNPLKPKAKDAAYSRAQVLSIEELMKLETYLLKEVVLKGIQNIKKVYAKTVKTSKYNEDTGEKETPEEWLIETDGTNMFSSFQFNEIDHSRTSSNDINEIYNVLGIEAVRAALINEVRSVLKPYDIYVNYRHIALLCEVMTQKGFLTSITRHGLNRAGNGPIRKCSFEETVEILLQAGMYAERDDLLGISENVLLGKLAPLGTGCFDLMIDKDAIISSNMIAGGKENEEGYEMNDTPIRENSPMRTPYESSSTPTTFSRNTLNFNNQVDPNMAQFTPGYNVNLASPSRNEMGGPMYIATPNPMIRPNTPLFNPSDFKTPVYSPLPYQGEINSSYSPLQRSPLMQNTNSVIRRGAFLDQTSPRSVYSPTTPGMRAQNSSSPGYNLGSGGLYSSTPKQESGSGSSQYSAISPSFNPLSPRYGGHLQSSYSRNSPYYNPSINSGTNNAAYGGSTYVRNDNDNDNAQNKDQNENDKGNLSEIQSDEEGENQK